MVLMMIPIHSFGVNLPFSDVSSGEWYYSDVKNAWETGLINGFEDNTFRPDENMTYAQAIKLAACMNQKYTTGSVTLVNGSPQWYDSYVAYAKDKNIIGKNYDWNNNATRAEYVEIFSNALPDEALKVKNSIADNAIPDVTMAHSQASAIYKLYRAGILTGMDEIGTFEPNNNIRRSEVSAILTRMMNESARKDLTLGAVTPDTPGTPVTYTVVFNSNGGSTVESQSVQENVNVVRPPDPLLEGHTFAGWYRDVALTNGYDFNTAVTGNLTLYAKWVPNPVSGYMVIFNSNGGSSVDNQVVQDNQQVVRPADPIRSGFSFAGWYSDSLLKAAYDFSTPVTGNVTLYAKWDNILSNEYKVTFNSNGGSFVGSTMVRKNEKVTKPEDPVRVYYDFLGWYCDSELTTLYDFDEAVTGDLILYAKWNRKADAPLPIETIEDSWEDIIASVNDGTYRSKYKLGDTKLLNLQGVLENGTEFHMQIVAFDTDELADGSGKAAITWISKELLRSGSMNSYRYTEDAIVYEKIKGWEQSEMRSWLKSDILPGIPAVVRDAIKPVTKYSRTYDSAREVVPNARSIDDLWIPSKYEVIGATKTSETEGPSYTSFFQTNEDRIKKAAGRSNASLWWLRSAFDSSSYNYVYSDGSLNNYGLLAVNAVAIGFCL